jgi:hypothetical protein
VVLSFINITLKKGGIMKSVINKVSEHITISVFIKHVGLLLSFVGEVVAPSDRFATKQSNV